MAFQVCKESVNKLVYKVYVLSEDKKKYYYIWQIEKVKKEGMFKDCWMTTGVSDPIYLGEIIWQMNLIIFVKNVKKKMKVFLKIWLNTGTKFAILAIPQKQFFLFSLFQKFLVKRLKQ